LADADEIEQRPPDAIARSTLYVVAALMLVMIIWASVSDVDKIVVARGKLVTPLPNIVIQPLETSVLQSLDVRVGQVVKKGERLAVLDPTFASADLEQARARHGSLSAEVARLESELTLNSGSAAPRANSEDQRLHANLLSERRANFQAHLRQLDESLSRLKASLVTNQKDQEILEARAKSLLEIEGMQQKLVDAQYGAKLKVLESREHRQEIERDLVQTRNRALEIRKEVASTEAQREAFVKEWRQKAFEELVTAKRERDGIAEQLNKAERRQSLVYLVAPADAVVLEIAKRSVGSVLREAEPLFTLVPLNAPLEAEVQINSEDVGLVKVGDPSRIKIDAFPYQRHGIVDGAVRHISEDAFSRDNPAQIAAAARQSEAYYLSRIDLGPIKLEKVPKNTRLLPGMTLTAEVVIGQRKVISYFLYPILRTLDESIREP
jgi:HlyD family secretion protein